MDAITKLNEQFLSCNICTEIFKDPCTIGCYHTFCRRCLTQYTQIRRDAITAKSILCPNCNQMTKVPRPQEPVDQWCQQFKPSFLIQGLLDTFTSQEISDPIEHCCFTCQQIGKTSHAKSACEDCGIMVCENCAKMHVSAPNGADHIVSPLVPGEAPRLKKRKAMCTEHNSLIEFCCSDCQKVVCSKCCIFYHRKCSSVATIESMVPEIKQVLQQNCDDIDAHIQRIENTLKSRRTEVENITHHNSSLQSEIRRVSQQAVDLIRRKEKKLLDELRCTTEKQTEQLRNQIKAGEIDLQTFQQYTEFIKQVLQSDSPMDLYDLYTLYRSGEITAEIQRYDKTGDRLTTVIFDNQLDVHKIDKILQLGNISCVTNEIGLQDISTTYLPTAILQCSPKLLFTVSISSEADKKESDPCDIEVLNIGGTDTLVVLDFDNLSVKSCYTKGNRTHCTSLQLGNKPTTITKISHNKVAVSFLYNYTIELINVTPDPVHVYSITTKKKYRCLTTLSETTLAAGCVNPPSIDVLNLSGRVLRSVITPSTGQELIQKPRYMCPTRQGHIVVTDKGSHAVYYVTQQGDVLYTHALTGRRPFPCGGVTTTYTGSVLVVDYFGNKILELTDTGEYVRDMLTSKDGIHRPQGICTHDNKLYVTERGSENIKLFQL